MKKTYQVVTNQKILNLKENELTEQFEVTGFHLNERTRKELYGEYKLAGLVGPMYNGFDNEGNVVIRYESPGHYATYD